MYRSSSSLSAARRSSTLSESKRNSATSMAGGPTRHRLPVEHRHGAPIPTRIEEHVVEMEVGVDQRLRSCVQRLGHDDELRTKPIEDVDEAVRQPVAVPSRETGRPALRTAPVVPADPARTPEIRLPERGLPTTERGRARAGRSRAARRRRSNRPAHRPAGRRSDRRVEGRRVAAPRQRPSSTASARTRPGSRCRSDALAHSARSTGA